MTIDLLAATDTGVKEFGFWEAMNQGAPVSYIILAILVIMSIGTLYILIVRFLDQAKILKQYHEQLGNFWRANSLSDGAKKLDKNSAWRQIVDDALSAEDQHSKMTDAMEAHDWLHGSLSRSEAAINSKLAGGLPFLATTGATAPFIGLLGTVIGIYRALINIGLSGSASLDKVAGPVGEALIMTAIGLIVAVPAVLAYNWLQARNKRIASLLNGFSTDILANINSKGAVKPAIASKAPASKTAAKSPAKPAASTTAKKS